MFERKMIKNEKKVLTKREIHIIIRFVVERQRYAEVSELADEQD